ncbi:helix-turn-helix domain-containing protein [Candidatus Pacearchaeota archaeon]|nr:helix-turn-helix domain-containing protein [Candidatus Pacearchaeota archaeon]
MKNGRKREKIELIRCMAPKVRSVEMMTAVIGASEGTIRSYASEYRIPLPPNYRLNGKNSERAKQIQNYLDEGINSVRKISRLLGVSESTILRCALSHGLKLPNRKSRREKITDLIKQTDNFTETGEDFFDALKSIRRKYKLSIGTLIYYAKAISAELPVNTYHARNIDDVDGTIETAQKLKDAGRGIEVSRERARQILHALKRHDSLRESKNKKKEELGNVVSSLEGVLSNLSGALNGIVNEKAKGDWAAREALDYLREHPRAKRSFSFLYDFFSFYKDAFDKGEKLSLYKLGENSGIFFTQAGRILSNAGLETLCRDMSFCRAGEREDIREKIEKGIKHEVSLADIAYFISVPRHVVSYEFSRNFKKEKRKSGNYGGGNLGFSYRAASRIYEVVDLDLGFDDEEIAELLDFKEGLIKYSKKNRKEFAERITSLLSSLYNKKFETPYVKIADAVMQS